MLDQKAVRRVLRDWDSLKALGENPLASLPIVLARHQAAGYTATLSGYGLALREAFLYALECLRPEPGPPNYQEKRWRPYIILTEQYVQGRNPDWVREQLHVSKGTYYGEQEHALEMLADVLQQQQVKGKPGELREDTDLHLPSGIGSGRKDPLRTGVFLCQAPLQPAHALVGREDIFTLLKQQLVGEPETQLAAGGIAALVGLPGVGKTALAVALAHDRQIQTHFCDGILWAGLGRTPDLPAVLSSWGAALGVPAELLAQAANPTERAGLLHSAIGMRRMLLIIDDAWQVEAALTLKLGGPNCAHLLTTRMVDLAVDFTGGPITVIHELGPEHSLELLNLLSPYAVQANPEAIRQLIRMVGGLPLALILMGGYLQKQGFNQQRRRVWQTLERLQAAEARMQVAQPQAPTDPHPGLPAGTPLSLDVVIGLSDTALDDLAHRALLDLSLFPPKPNTFSEEAALAVADIKPEILDRLVDCGLLECNASDRYTLHQTVADYAACTVYAPYVIYTAPSRGASPEAVNRMRLYYREFLQAHHGDAAALECEMANMIAAGVWSGPGS